MSEKEEFILPFPNDAERCIFAPAKNTTYPVYHCEIKPSLRPFFICPESVRASSNCSFNSGYFSAIGTRYFTGVNCMVRFDNFKSAKH